PPVCIENLIRIDCVTESPKTSSGMIALLSFFPILFASPLQVEEPTESASGHKQTLAPFLGHVRLAPESRHGSASLPCPLCAMCGRLRVGKGFLHACRLVGAAMCSAC